MIIQWIKSHFNNTVKWQDIEYFDENWMNRIQQMATYLSESETIVDLGCGKMWLKDLMPHGAKYYGVDYTPRDQNTIICDFNNNEYPNFKVDTSFISGCFEYVKDYHWFIKQIAKYSDKCILSYCTLDTFENIEKRKRLCWENHLSNEEIIKLFSAESFSLICRDITETNNSIYVFQHQIIKSLDV